MSTSPTPSEREAKDKADRAREAEEQAKLPYKWRQTIGDVDVDVPVAANLRGRDIVVEMTKTKLKVGVKGQEPVIDVSGYFDPFLELGSPSRGSCCLLLMCWECCVRAVMIFLLPIFLAKPALLQRLMSQTNRAPSPTRSNPPNPPGRSKLPPPRAKKSPSTWTNPTRCSGGRA